MEEVSPTLTHYQVLGVRRDASRQEIRRAYHELARRYHPDHRGPAPERARTSIDIATLNEAWRVLGDPTLRRRYDATLRPRPAPRRRPPAPTRVAAPFADDRDGWGRMVDPVFAPLPPRYRPPKAHRTSSRRFARLPLRAWLLVGILAVLAVIVVFTAYAGSGGGPVGPAPGLPRVGSCVTIPPAAPVRVVPCGEANDGRVVAPVGPDRHCPRGATALAVLPGRGVGVCLGPG